MAATLQMADEKRAYSITDRATYLAWRDRLQLLPLVEGDSLLYNVYHVMEVSPHNAPRVNVAGARPGRLARGAGDAAAHWRIRQVEIRAESVCPGCRESGQMVKDDRVVGRRA
jgi:hypothetical protein